ncbi:MAG: zinc ribbon domain-containing protein [Thermodesulfobacteriota bacterium]
MKCTRCNQEIQSGWNACPACGQKIAKKHVCQGCGKEIDLSFQFCPSCGKATTEGEARVTGGQPPRKLLTKEKRGAVQHAFCDAVRKHDFETAEELLEEGANINGGDEGGPILKDVCLGYDYQSVKWLLDHGANPNSPPYSFTPLIAVALASSSRPEIAEPCIAIMKLLIEAGADVNAIEKEGRRAIKWTKGKVKDFLLSHGAIVE